MDNNSTITKKQATANKTERLPKVCKIIYIIAAVCVAVLIISIFCTPFADFYNDRISWIFRMVLSFLTIWIPFSFAEYIVILLPVAAVCFIIYANRRFSSTWKSMWVFCGILGSIVAALFSLYILSFGVGYRCSTLDVKLEMDRENVSTQELSDTAHILSGKINEELDSITFTDDGDSIMPYTFFELNDKLIEAYDKIAAEYDFITNYYSRLKPVMLSEPLTYTHIAGVYTYFTGETNINVNFPDYTLPYTAAHELAHQRGIAREDEANFVAFLVCMASDDPYIRYSGYISVYEYVASALYYADSEEYAKVAADLDKRIIGEMRAYNIFYEKYADSAASAVSGAINDTILKIQGTEGEKSYGMVVDLAVAYYRNEK